MAHNITLEQIIDFIQETPMFWELEAKEIAEIVHIMQVQAMRAGQPVFKEGEDGDGWYVVYQGNVEVIKRTSHGEQRIATLNEGACFGEMAILDGSRRSATVRAGKDGVLFRFPRTAFTGLLDAGNLSAYKLTHQMALVLAARQRAVTARLAELLQAKDDELRQGLSPLLESGSIGMTRAAKS